MGKIDKCGLKWNPNNYHSNIVFYGEIRVHFEIQTTIYNDGIPKVRSMHLVRKVIRKITEIRR